MNPIDFYVVIDPRGDEKTLDTIVIQTTGSILEEAIKDRLKLRHIRGIFQTRQLAMMFATNLLEEKKKSLPQIVRILQQRP